MILLIVWPDDPRRDNNKWPAIMLAVSRIESVIGRIINLIDSIITIKGIKIHGVLEGVKWESILLVNLIHPNNIIPIHKVIEKDKQNLIWLDEVKINGNNPIKLLNKIIIKCLKKIIKFDNENLIIILNSLNKNIKI